jgi:hypothetical protein
MVGIVVLQEHSARHAVPQWNQRVAGLPAESASAPSAFGEGMPTRVPHRPAAGQFVQYRCFVE